ncbi:MAG: effector binding domain-containing protein [Defluviitaleaceae bacterium]|nr:effector binding domain-containing protein [Defluviitaleaceae bacterium]MCL2835750.1 effector binding domain-containing protein [Defluviitaleaceae bacterium]
MLRIGEAAKRFDISNRTLRYWEEMGILKSIRTENDYRYYDDENVMRINQIALLRKLRMPIADIERIFLAPDFGVAIDALNKHLENLKQDAAVYNSLIIVINNLIRHIESSENLENALSSLEIQNANTGLEEHKPAPQIQLSERVMLVSASELSNVRIVSLPAMTVAAYRAESATPENDCSKVFNKFVLENNLHKRSGYRYFGFNNPNPGVGSPVYGYEMWVTVPDDFEVPEPLVKKQFGGGLYASVSTHMNEIGERWNMLYYWCVNSTEYNFEPSVQCLEECSMDFETFTSDTVSDNVKQLDLLAPIKRK